MEHFWLTLIEGLVRARFFHVYNISWTRQIFALAFKKQILNCIKISFKNNIKYDLVILYKQKYKKHYENWLLSY